MAGRKKSTTPKRVAEEAIDIARPGPRYVDGFLHFNGEDLYRYELAQYKLANALQGLGIKKSEHEKILTKAKADLEALEKAHVLELAHLKAHAQLLEKELRELQELLEGAYKLDFKQVTYDDRSGKILLLGEPVSEERS